MTEGCAESIVPEILFRSEIDRDFEGRIDDALKSLGAEQRIRVPLWTHSASWTLKTIRRHFPEKTIAILESESGAVVVRFRATNKTDDFQDVTIHSGEIRIERALVACLILMLVEKNRVSLQTS